MVLPSVVEAFPSTAFHVVLAEGVTASVDEKVALEDPLSVVEKLQIAPSSKTLRASPDSHAAVMSPVSPPV